MENGEKNLLIFSGAVISAIAIVVFLVVLVFAFLVFLPIFQAPQSNTPGSNNVPGSSVPVNNVSDNPVVMADKIDDAFWSKISKVNVESLCLSEAKRVAGGNAWAVDSCSCSEKSASGKKEFSCSVSALDGEHPVSIECFKKEGYCLVVSEQGASKLTVDDLKKFAE